MTDGFVDRADAGKQLASKLGRLEPGTIILGLPRGGVVVAAKIAEANGLPLDVLITKKLGAPGDPEYAIGAVGLTATVLTHEARNVSKAYIEAEIQRLRRQVRERYQLLRGKPEPPEIRGKNVIIVDDGMATGASMEAAVKEAQALKPAKIIVAVPIASREAVEHIQKIATVVCLGTPPAFFAVGSFYDEFEEVTDEDCAELLKGNKR